MCEAMAAPDMQYAICGVDHLGACWISGLGGIVMLHRLHPDTTPKPAAAFQHLV